VADVTGPSRVQSTVLSGPIDVHLRHLASTSDFQLYKEVSSSPRGLTEDDAAARLVEYGENAMPESERPSIASRLAAALRSPFVALMTTLGVIFVVLGDGRGATIVAIMVASAVVLRMWHQGRSLRVVLALRADDFATATVRRRANHLAEPTTREIPAADIVPGDVVVLEAGDRVPADLRIVAGIGLSLDQSVISGEAAPVEKCAKGADDADTSLAGLSRLCLAGSAVVAGSAVGVVVATGAHTYTSSVWKHAAREPHRSSFDDGVRSVGWTLVHAMLVMAAVVFVVRGAFDGQWKQAAVLAVAVAVGLTPEMLPVIVSAALGAGAARLAERRVIVKRLEAIQDLGAMDVLCVDKTGTLTEDRVVYAQSVDARGTPDPMPAQRAAMACRLRHDLAGRFDDAIAAVGVSSHGEDDGYRRVDEFPFDHRRRRASVVIADPVGRHELTCLGDADVVLARCNAIRVAGMVLPLTSSLEDEARDRVEAYSRTGTRVLAVAVRDVPARQPERRDAGDECDMTLAGFVTFVDPVRTEAPGSLRELADLGVSVRMLSGDSLAVAVEVARRVGMPTDGAQRGSDVDLLSDDELRVLAGSVAVYAELTPAHKKRIVEQLRARGDVVGFVGDGVNDIPALRAADAGIATDTAGDAIKDVADVIMLEPNLAAITEAVVQGRRTLVNVMKYVRITASSNLGNAMSIVAAGLLLPFLPILPMQLLVQNLLYDCAQLALPWDRVDVRELRAPRRFRPDGLVRFMLTFGAVSSVFDAVTFAALWWVFGGADHETVFRTGWFMEGLLSQLLIVQVLRSGAAPWRRPRPAAIVVLSASLVALIGCVLPLSPLASVLRLEPMPAGYGGFLVVVLLGYGVVAAVVKRLYALHPVRLSVVGGPRT
jgi:P-type Mg2+ transporter